MDLQIRKLNLITYLAQVQDEVLLEKLESYILKNEGEFYSELKPFTIEELVNRIKKSELDFKEGEFKSQEDLEKTSENW
ncbi:hypothetical protein ES731_05595 [Psychroflexus gondwanensis]|jgi:hypothetical protein|uniref:Uncharacterized protein n=1 Tax=Psychroflexus gondwanensis ACAM 44 TaxID=1189619 RepID=N1WY34_9FLAO|nr:hypothetical protein [Psychroflexus gondwanensis]EMY81999.1 hypothetical protein pgond44_05655 [Psychroflexus gondwanensis ACAM 44]TXE20488.1 hypothetical protein ES731_05595 [Psychroflexus gondwanensis]